MEEWKKLVRDTVNTPEKLAAVFDVDLDEIKRVHEVFPIRINPYYLSLIEEPGDPIWKQVVPDAKELIRTGLRKTIHSVKKMIALFPTSHIATRIGYCFMSITCVRFTVDSAPESAKSEILTPFPTTISRWAWTISAVIPKSVT